MTKYLWIPVLGTIAAAIAVWTMHDPEAAAQPPTYEFPPFDPDAEAPPVFPPRPPEPPLVPDTPPVDETPAEYTLVLEEDGTFTVENDDRALASVEKALEELAPEGAPRPRVTLTNASGAVGKDALEAAARALAAKCDVRQYYRAPEQDDDAK